MCDEEINKLRHKLYEMTVARDDYQRDLNGLIYELKQLHKESPLLYIDLKNQTLMHQDKYFHLKKVLEME